MSTKEAGFKVLFGLRLKKLRMDAGYSLAQLASLSQISASYLNEIEKGRKYPKEEKLRKLSEVFELSFEDFTSNEIQGHLAPLSDVFSQKGLDSIPLDIFGIDFIRLGEWMGAEPNKAGAFFNTIVQIAKSYNLEKEDAYFAALRAYRELNNNYFESLERKADQFRKKRGQKDVQSYNHLANILISKYEYSISDFPASDLGDLKSVRSFFSAKSKTLFINPALNESQRLFVVAKELGYIVLKIKDRSKYPLSIEVGSFQHLLNNMQASYFASALLIPKGDFLKDISELMSREKWDGLFLQGLLAKYNVSPDIFVHRTSSLVPEGFGLKSLYLQRFEKNLLSGSIKITNELHINGAQTPHANQVYQTYCRRWGGIRALNHLGESPLEKGAYNIEVQRSKFHDTSKEYLVVTLSRHLYPTPNVDTCVSIGFSMTNTFKEKVSFWEDPDIPQRIVNITCETCSLENCSDRAAEAKMIQKEINSKRITDTIDRLL